MKDVRKLAGKNLGIDAQKTTLLKKPKLIHIFCEACVMGKHHRTLSRVIYRIDQYK